MYRSLVLLFILSACTPEAVPEPPAPLARVQLEDERCVLAFAPSPGPLADRAAQVTDPVVLAELRIREARLANDPGFLTLAELALDCALGKDPRDPVARRWKGHVDIQFHRFEQAENELFDLVKETDHWRDHLLLGDARMEKGDLDGAKRAYDTALEQRPTLEAYDRLAHLAWLQGDLARAVEFGELAFGAATGADPEVAAWTATALGTWRMYAGQRPNELGMALKFVPDYPHAHLALGRYFLSLADKDPESKERAAEHLRKAGPTVAAVRALREIDPSADVDSVKEQDRRGYGLWLALTDPAAALPLLDQELAERRDAVTVIGRAWVASRAGQDLEAQRQAVAGALSTGIADASALLMAAEVTGDQALAARALALPAGLLPSERQRALQVAAGSGR